MKQLKQKISIENLLCLYVILCPILDIISFLYRNYFETSISPATIIRPIIPLVCFSFLFFKEKNKLKKVFIILVYLVYSLVHIYLFQKLHNESSYGNIRNELQYIINYSLMIINLYLFYNYIKDTKKIKKSIYISLIIYVISIYFSIITNTSSHTYIEGIGFKGYFESGNSLCTVLILSLCIMLSDFKINQWRKLALIIFTGIYLLFLSKMRTGLFGFSIIIAIWIIGNLIISIRDKKSFSKKQITLTTICIIIITIAMFVLGSKTLERRKFLKESELENIDEETNEQRFVTGDILDLYKQIKNHEISEEYMSNAEQVAIVDLCEFAKKHKISNVDLRKQQLIYNVFLVKEQKNALLILFGNGYKNQTGELVMEMEVPAILLNFGIIGFILYLGPILYLFLAEIYKVFKDLKNIKIDKIMYLTGGILAIILSCVSGYVFFNLSSMTMAIIILIIGEKN